MAEGQVRLDLQVGLDTAYLQGQLATIGTRLAGQGINLAVQFNRDSIAKEYSLLQRSIGSKTFKLKIESTTLDSLFAKIQNFEDRLKRLQGETIKLDVEVGGIASIKNKGEARKIRTGLRNQILSEGGKIRIETSIIPKITKEDIDNFKAVVQSKLAGLKVKVGVEPSVTTGGAATGGRQRPAGFTAARESIANLNVEQLRSRAFKSLGQESRAAQQVSQWLDNIVTQGLKGADKTRQLSAVRDFLADALAQVARKDIQASLRQLDPNRRGPFPNVAKTGPIEPKLLFQEAMQIAAAVDAAYARTAQAMAQQSAQLRAASSRLLPPGREAIAGGSAQQKAVQDFYARMRQAEQMFARHFSANSYLPVASRNLAKAMNAARRQLLLPGRRVAGALPSSEMRAALQFRQARESAAAIDAANAERFRARQAREASRRQLVATREQLQVPLLPSAGQSLGSRSAAESILRGQAFFTPYVPPPRNPALDRIDEEIAARVAAREARGPGLFSRLQGMFGVGGGGQPPRGPQPPQGMGGGGDGQPPSRGGALGFRLTELPANYYENVRRFNAALDVARGSMRNFQGAQMPFIGGLRGIASELGVATKQVLLYGAAYKGLAFIVSLPGQMINATKSQQQYTNSLQTATQSTSTFGKELLFVDNIQRTFGLNLEGTRTGFTRLFASMAPAGFDSGSIEKLFTGISAAAASLQLTPDKVDRVTYAFGQMASKGQIMSEELRGQLGDVLPGALSLFAKAAGMSIKDFSKAMEDGEFTGRRFQEVFAAVSDELLVRFGTGAQAASKSITGLTNKVQGEFQRTMEAFSPLVEAAIGGVLGRLPVALRQIATAGQIATGEIERVYKQLKQAQADLVDLRESGASPQQIQGAEQSIAALQLRYEALNEAARDPAIANQISTIQRFAQELETAGRFIMNMASTIGNILGPVLTLLGTNLTGVISAILALVVGFQTARLAAAALMGALILFRTVTTALGLSQVALQAGGVATAFNMLGVNATRTTIQVVGLRVALTALVSATIIGAVVGGVMMIAGAFASARDRAKEAAQASKDYAKAAIDAAASADVAGASMGVQGVLSESRKTKAALDALERIMASSTPEQRRGIARLLSPQEALALRGNPLTEGLLGGVAGGRQLMRVPSRQEFESLKAQFGSIAGQQSYDLAQAKEAEKLAEERRTRLGLSVPGALPPAGAEVDEKAQKEADKAADEERRRREQAASQEQQRILALADMRNRLDQIGFDKYKALNEDALDFARRMIDAEFDYREARANRFGKMQIDIARKVGEQQQNIDEALLKYRMGIIEGQVKAAAAQAKAAAADQADAVMSATGAYMQGNIGPTSTGPHFDVKKVGGDYFPREYLDQFVRVNGRPLSSGTTVRGGTFAAHQARGSHGWDYAFGEGEYAATLTGGAEWMEGVPTEHGERRRFRLPTGETFQFLHGMSRGITPATQGSPVSGTAFATEKRGEAAKRDAQIAQQQAAADAEINSQRLLNSLREAEANTKTIIAQAMDRVLPLEEQRLENMLSETRLSAQLAGLSDAQVEALMKQKEATMGTEATVAGFRDSIISLQEAQRGYDKLLADGKIEQADYAELTKMNTGLIQQFKESIVQANVELPLFNQELERTAAMEELARPFVALATAIRDAKQSLADMANPLFQTISIAEGVGNAFGETFRGLISGASSTREALAGFFQSLSDMFADMVAKMLAEWAKLQIMKLFSPNQGAGGLLGFNLASSGTSLLSSGLGAASSSVAFNPLAFSGVQLFAKGGVVTGPTMGLVGEGRFNEAVVPLPDGKSIPVSLNGGGSGGINVVVNVDAKGTSVQGDDMMGKQLGTAISSAVQAELIKQQRPGGLLSTPRR
jgi:tape measure domain-containing protein